jgi:hypothetical protein
MMADTLVTPLNDSFVDFDVLGTLDPINYTVTGESHYAEMVCEARRQRRLVDGKLTDWIAVRNRPSSLGSRNRKLVGDRAAARAGCRSWTSRCRSTTSSDRRAGALRAHRLPLNRCRLPP